MTPRNVSRELVATFSLLHAPEEVVRRALERLSARARTRLLGLLDELQGVREEDREQVLRALITYLAAEQTKGSVDRATDRQLGGDPNDSQAWARRLTRVDQELTAQEMVAPELPAGGALAIDPSDRGLVVAYWDPARGDAAPVVDVVPDALVVDDLAGFATLAPASYRERPGDLQGQRAVTGFVGALMTGDARDRHVEVRGSDGVPRRATFGTVHLTRALLKRVLELRQRTEGRALLEVIVPLAAGGDPLLQRALLGQVFDGATPGRTPRLRARVQDGAPLAAELRTDVDRPIAVVAAHVLQPFLERAPAGPLASPGEARVLSLDLNEHGLEVGLVQLEVAAPGRGTARLLGAATVPGVGLAGLVEHLARRLQERVALCLVSAETFLGNDPRTPPRAVGRAAVLKPWTATVPAQELERRADALVERHGLVRGAWVSLVGDAAARGADIVDAVEWLFPAGHGPGEVPWAKGGMSTRNRALLHGTAERAVETLVDPVALPEPLRVREHVVQGGPDFRAVLARFDEVVAELRLAVSREDVLTYFVGTVWPRLAARLPELRGVAPGAMTDVVLTGRGCRWLREALAAPDAWRQAGLEALVGADARVASNDAIAGAAAARGACMLRALRGVEEPALRVLPRRARRPFELVVWPTVDGPLRVGEGDPWDGCHVNLLARPAATDRDCLLFLLQRQRGEEAGLTLTFAPVRSPFALVRGAWAEGVLDPLGVQALRRRLEERGLWLPGQRDAEELFACMDAAAPPGAVEVRSLRVVEPDRPHPKAPDRTRGQVVGALLEELEAREWIAWVESASALWAPPPDGTTHQRYYLRPDGEVWLVYHRGEEKWLCAPTITGADRALVRGHGYPGDHRWGGSSGRSGGPSHPRGPGRPVVGHPPP